MIGVIELLILIPLVLIALLIPVALLFALWKLLQLSRRVEQLEKKVDALSE